MKTITMKKFEELLKEKGSANVNIIDVREKDAFNLTHIEGADNIPLNELAGEVGRLDKEKKYYLICYSGSFSTMGSQYLKQNGFEAINVQSGMNGYSGPTV